MTEVLAEPAWRARQAVHEARVDAWTAPVLARAGRGEAHPVEDFLFTYYGHRPGRLRRWSPGLGVALVGAAPAPPWVAGPAGAVLGPPSERVRRQAARTADLLERTASRPAQLCCSGLHEWAMVHRAPQVRHDLPLRLGAEATSAVVDRLPVRCSHFDAFRFFTPTAAALNALQPTRDSQPDLEQPGCLHANMDLYRAAYTLSPWVTAELVADAFDLARRIRVLDMRASPYDLAGLGLAAVPVETAAGRADYAREQAAFADEAAPLRRRLVTAARRLLAEVPPGSQP